MFSLFKKKKPFFTEVENAKIVEAIKVAETSTSGEIRVFVESKCSYVDPLDRAIEIFSNLKMEETENRNAVLVYVALKDRQLALFADQGIHTKTIENFWKLAAEKMISHFNRENYADGIANCVHLIGEALKQHFPYDKEVDKNELPDEIIFGK